MSFTDKSEETRSFKGVMNHKYNNKEKNMEIKVIQVGIERNKPLYKVIGSNFGKRGFEVDVFSSVNPIQAVERATECNYGSLKMGDYFRAPELDNLNDYWMLKYCYKYMNGIYKYYSDAQACAAG